MEASDLIARAGTGGHDGFSDPVGVHSRVLQALCHHTLGSP